MYRSDAAPGRSTWLSSSCVPINQLSASRGPAPRSARSDQRFLDDQRLRGGLCAVNAAVLGHGGLDSLGDPLAGEADFLVQQLGRAVGHISVRQADAEDPRGQSGV